MTVKWRHCAIAERDHRKDVRNYAHTYHYPRTICFAKAFWELPREYRDGILLHEIGHLLAGPEGSESDANDAVFDWTGAQIEYVDSPYGRRLERVKNVAGVRIIRRRSVILNPDDPEDIDWKQRYGQEEQPEVAEYLGHERATDRPEPDSPRAFWKQRADGKYHVEFVYPRTGARVTKIMSKDKFDAMVAKGDYLVYHSSR